jgi:hypothetical protein
MATGGRRMTYPDGIDALVNVNANDSLALGGHAARHNSVNTALVEVKDYLVGALGSKLDVSAAGQYQAWTPTVGAGDWVFGNATSIARYATVGDLVHVYGIITFGSTSTFGTGGGLFINLPISPGSGSANTEIAGVSVFFDTGTATFSGFTSISGGGFLYFTLQQVNSTYAVSQNISNTTPFTWTNGDKIQFNMIYEGA